MEQLRYSIRKNESINRWLLTQMQQQPFESPMATFDAPVNLEEGYVQIVYPVRKAFLEENRIGSVPYYSGPYEAIYFPFEGNRVDFTTFNHAPHYLSVNGKTYLEVEKTGTYTFDVYTCGGVKLWLNKEEVLCFTPYTRNINSKCTVKLLLQKGGNELSIYADELAERDVFFYFELRYLDDGPITVELPIETDAAAVKDTETFLESCYFPHDSFEKGELGLYYDSKYLKNNMKLTVTGLPEIANKNDGSPKETMEIEVSKEKNMASLGKIEFFHPGFFQICLTAQVDSIDISRKLVVGIKPAEQESAVSTANNIAERKASALHFIKTMGETASEQVITKTLAILECERKFTLQAETCLRNSMAKIKKKEDCADFYLVPLFLLISRYSDILPEELLDEIKTDILNFRYWIDEPGNDVMWYFSENHALLFHIAQYLAGHKFPKEQFTASGHSGMVQYNKGKNRLYKWFDTFFRYGFAEWNSATYIPIDLIGFFVLFELAPDHDIREKARQALDFTFKIIAYNSFNGVMSSSFGRAYEDTLKAREQVEPSFLEWVAWGTGNVTFRSRAVSLFCLSSYVPPDFLNEISIKKGQWMDTELDQGIAKAKTYSFRTSDYFIACVRNFRPFYHGHQQHLMNVALGQETVQFYINHPGEPLFSGGNRPSYWAGNGTNPVIEQYNNLILMVFNIDKNELVHYIHGYCLVKSFDEYVLKDHWFFARTGEAYIAGWFSSRPKLTQTGSNTSKEIVAEGLNHAVLVKCGSSTEFGNFSTFMDLMENSRPEYDGEQRVTVTDPQYGIAELQGEKYFHVNGEEIVKKPRPELFCQKGDLTICSPRDQA